MSGCWMQSAQTDWKHFSSDDSIEPRGLGDISDLGRITLDLTRGIYTKSGSKGPPLLWSGEEQGPFPEEKK
jgi:hypothetical protein